MKIKGKQILIILLALTAIITLSQKENLNELLNKKDINEYLKNETVDFKPSEITEDVDIINKTVEAVIPVENQITEDPIEEIQTPVEAYENITLSFVGDMYLGDKLYSYYQNAGNNVSGFMDENIINNFKDVDIMVANHEYASTNLTESNKDKRQLYNFKAPTDREIIWKELGVDVLSLANNHAMDYGEQSLFDTIEALDDLELAHIGAGEDLEAAKKAYITEINGKKIAILAACRFVVDGEWYATENTSGVLTTYDTTEYFDVVKKEITRLKEEENCDFVAIYVHFGTEKKNMPNENQPIIAHGYIDSGADLVIGSHAHTLQGIEFYKEKPIYYNLGNFLFSSYKVDTMVVNISINGDNTCTTSIVPCVAQDYKVTAANHDEYYRILNYIESISINAEIDENGNVYEKTN